MFREYRLKIMPTVINPVNAKPIFGKKKKKKGLRNFIATLVFMRERKILSTVVFCNQLVEIFHRTMK